MPGTGIPRKGNGGPPEEPLPGLRYQTPVGVRLGLQRHARTNLRRHVLRALRRFVVLLIADLAALELVRLIMGASRGEVILGVGLRESLDTMIARGTLGGWQLASALILGLYLTGNYDAGHDRRDPKRLFAGCALAVALPLWIPFWQQGPSLILPQYLVLLVMVWGAVVIERLTVDRLIRLVFPVDRHAARTLFVGEAGACRDSALNPTLAKSGDFQSVGFIDTAPRAAPDALGAMDDFTSVLHDSRAEVVVACGYLTDDRLHDVAEISLAAGCHLISVPRSIAVAGVQPNLIWRDGQPLMELTAPTLKARQLVVKRAMDLVGATFALLVALPVMVAAALAIKLDSPGPVIFRQDRIGIGGRRFRVWKFRTMRNGASDAAHRDLVTRMQAGDEVGTAHRTSEGRQVYKLVNDDRVTRVGQFLRKTSIDELPQLFNVVRGEMSLVGPRPPLPYEFEAYDQWQFDRLEVRPGITGLWQVSGRNCLSYRRMCELDVQYVRNWSLFLDFRILVKTIPVVLLNSGKAA
ncbi:MAG: sugar transferase [Gemmatimonadales bacterium]